MTSDPLFAEAMKRFEELFEKAGRLDMKEPAAAALATCDSRGFPTVRIVLLRGFDERGFVFFTNADSLKGQQMADNPRAALCFYWDALVRQVRVEGSVQRVSAAESDRYWATRSRASQISAWASDQSRTLEDRELLLQRVKEVEERFAGTEVARPDHWLGYRVVPERIEFWESRPARLHERTVYEKGEEGWWRYLVYP
jgi:pyridoxamine 5'-phosphate oxidase